MTKKLLIGSGVSRKCLVSLSEMGYETVLLPPFSRLQRGVSAHIDMLVFYFGGDLITHVDYYKENKSLFDGLGVNVITTDEEISPDYPNDILFNAVLTEDRILYAKSNHTSQKIKQLANEIVDVKQGYTACSTCKASGNAFITSDEGLHKIYSRNGIDSLLVEKEGIELPGYSCGFIGGASAVFDEYVCFFGSLDGYKDGEKIKKFIEKYGKKAIELSDEKLMDIGGCVAL